MIMTFYDQASLLLSGFRGLIFFVTAYVYFWLLSKYSIVKYHYIILVSGAVILVCI